MKDVKHHCEGFKDCKSEVKLACSFGGCTYFLCKECMHLSLSTPLPHVLLSYEQAAKFTTNNSPLPSVTTQPERNSEFERSLLTYLNRIQNFRLKIERFKYKLIKRVEQECQKKLEHLSQMYSHAKLILNSLQIRKKHFYTIDEDLLSNYQSKGLKGVLKDYKDSFQINHYDISHVIKSMIIIREHSPEIKEEYDTNLEDLYTDIPLEPQESTKSLPEEFFPYTHQLDSIYIAKHSTKKLIKYDLAKNQTKSFDLSETVSQNFYYSSTCVLPDGSIMIVGGKGPVTGVTYRFDPCKAVCISLSGMAFPRGYVHLYCLGKYLYAFGGQHSNKAERMEWKSNGWSTLPNMHEERYCFSSFYLSNKLFLIGGQNNRSVEYYDFIMNHFFLVPNVTVPKGGNVVGEIDNKIYLVRSKGVCVMNKEFREIETAENIQNLSVYNLADVVVRDKFIIFSCSNSCSMLYFNTENRQIGRLIKI